MDDITASIIVTCQTQGAVASINKLGFSFAMLTKKAFDFSLDAIGQFRATQDATWKFNKVFANSMGSATKAAEEFMDSYNLSEQSAKSMLGDTASILKGAGMGEKAALKMSEQVARMGVDLASYTGYAGGAKGATEAITAAMLGETDRLKGLGTVISMQSDEYKDLVKNIQNTKDVSEQQARAMAVLELVYRKNQDAIGDYMAEGENFTQTVNIWNEGWKQFKANIGTVIYETLGLNKSLGALGGWLEQFNKWFKKEGPGIILFLSELVLGLKFAFSTAFAYASSLTPLFSTAFQNIVAAGEWMNKNFDRIWEAMSSSRKNFFAALRDDLESTVTNYAKTIIGLPIALTEQYVTNPILKALGVKTDNYWLNLVNKSSLDFWGGLGANAEKSLKYHGVSPFPQLKSFSFDYGMIQKALKESGKQYEQELADLRKRVSKMSERPRDKKAADDITGMNLSSVLNNASLSEFANELFKYRSSVQEAVLGGSDEEFYMKNRYMMNTDVSPMQKAADGITALGKMGERMNRTLEELDRKLATLNTSSSETARALSNGKIYA